MTPLMRRSRSSKARNDDFIAFVDAGYGKQQRLEDNSWSATLTSVGLGWNLELDQWRSEIRWALPLTSDGTDDAIDDDDAQLYWTVRFVP